MTEVRHGRLTKYTLGALKEEVVLAEDREDGADVLQVLRYVEL